MWENMTDGQRKILLVGGGLLAGSLALLVLAGDYLPGFMAMLVVLVLLVAGAMFYLLPTFIAFQRGHASKLGILVLNLFFGWSFLGWIVSLIWALSSTGVAAAPMVVINQGNANLGATLPPMGAAPAWGPQAGYAQPGYQQIPAPAPAAAQPYQIGEVVNGHRFDGVSWSPVRQLP